MPHLEPATGVLPHEKLSHGCFETMRAYEGKVFRLEDHLDRLYASAKFLGTQAPSNRKSFALQLTGALQRSKIKEAMLRVALIPRPDDNASRGGGLQPKAESKPHIVVQPVPVSSKEAYRKGIRVAVIPARKFSVGSIDPRAKYSARLGSVLAVIDAQLREVDEAIFLDETSSVTESTASNFGIIRKGVIQTPPCWLGLLAGITRDVLFELAVILSLSIEEVPLTRHDIYNADEAFMTSTLKEVLGVSEIDGRRIGSGRPGPLTGKLLQGFRMLVKKELNLRGDSWKE